MASPIVHPLTSLTPQLLAVLKEGTDKRLQNVIGVLITSRYASSSPYLADFRSTTRDKDVKEDSTVLSDFRNLVPLTDYEAYRPWMAKFIERPCELSEVENLLAPGLPSFLAITGSTSGREPKYFTRYLAFAGLIRPAQDKVPSAFLTARTASTLWWGCIDLVEVTTPSGDVVKTIPVTGVTSGFARTMQGWSIETDNTRLTSLGEYLFDPNNTIDTYCYSRSSVPELSVGDGSHRSPSIFPPDPCPVRVGRSDRGANSCRVYYLFRGYGVLHTGRVGHAPVQHTRWDHS